FIGAATVAASAVSALLVGGFIYVSLRYRNRQEGAPGRCQPNANQGPLPARGRWTRPPSPGVIKPARLIGASDPSSWMRAPLEIRLLGPFEVVAGGTLAEVGGSKRQALL